MTANSRKPSTSFDLLMATALLGAVLLCTAGGCDRQQTPGSYAELDSMVDALAEEEDYHAAIHLLETQAGRFPDEAFAISDRTADLYRDFGRLDKTIETWRAGHACGFFYLIRPQIPIYEPFLELPGFDEIVAEDTRLRDSAMEVSRTLVEVVTPKGYDPSREYPLLIALHGGGSTNERAKSSWQSETLSRDYLTAFVQSYLHYGSESFGWRGHDPRARKDIKEIYEQVCANYSVDTTRVAVGGASAGGVMAVDIAINGIVPVSGLVGVCPGEPTEFNADRARAAAERGLRVFMIGGETDFMLPRQEKMVAAFDSAGLAYEYVVVVGLGHDFPNDFGPRLDSALTYLFPEGS